jgi:phosphoglycolate phosphatase-like HAD superfamily hydrolase
MHLESIPPNWFLRPSLELLAAAGTHLVIVSSGYIELIESYLSRWDIRDWFAEVSGKQKTAKSVRLRRRLADSERSLVIEDSPTYLRLARDCGAVTIGVRHAYNGLDAEADAVIDAGADHRRP